MMWTQNYDSELFSTDTLSRKLHSNRTRVSGTETIAGCG